MRLFPMVFLSGAVSPVCGALCVAVCFCVVSNCAMTGGHVLRSWFSALLCACVVVVCVAVLAVIPSISRCHVLTMAFRSRACVYAQMFGSVFRLSLPVRGVGLFLTGCQVVVVLAFLFRSLFRRSLTAVRCMLSALGCLALHPPTVVLRR